MFEDLGAAIETLDIPAGADALVAVIALRDRLDARIAEAAGAFESEGWWGLDASASMTAWLRAHAGMTARSAQRLHTTAARLRSLPVCAAAYADGTLSGGQIEAIVARLDDEVVEALAAQEAELIPYLVPLSVAGVSRAMAAWVTRARPVPTEPTEPERSLHLSRTIGDRWVLDGALDPEGGALMAAALGLAMSDERSVHRATRRADALVDICRFFLDHQRTKAGAVTGPT